MNKDNLFFLYFTLQLTPVLLYHPNLIKNDNLYLSQVARCVFLQFLQNQIFVLFVVFYFHNHAEA